MLQEDLQALLTEWRRETRTHLHEQDAKIDGLYTRIDSLERRFEDRLAGIDGRLDGIEQTLSIIKAVVLGEEPPTS